MTARSTFAPLLTAAALAIASGSVMAASGFAMVPQGERDYVPATASTGPALTRAEVRQQTRAAIADGLVVAGDDVDYGLPKQAPASTLTRAEVRAETLAAARAGELPSGGEEEFPAMHETSVRTGAHAAASQGAFSRLAAKLHGTSGN